MAGPGQANVHAVATGLRIDSATAEVLRAFAAEGVRCRLLKGPAIAQWLYEPGEPRYYIDSDLLVAPADLKRAEVVLERLGFVKRFDDSRMPEWWREHASEWLRPSDGVPLDVHRSLHGVGVGDDEAWSILSASPANVPVAGLDAPVLAASARALHVALHAAQHGEAQGRPLADLERAISRLDEGLWSAAARLAERLEATEALSAGLGLTAPGKELARRLGLPAPSSTAVMLHAAGPPAVALGIEQLVRARGVRARVSIIRHKVFPPPEFIRHWQPVGTDSRAGLARAYARRPFWLLRHTPRALRTWLAARRRARRGDP